MVKIVNDESHVHVSNLQKSAVKENTSDTAAKPSKDDQVQLSARDRVEDIMARIPDVRQEKVDELSRRIEDGTYKADPGKVTDKLIRESLIDILA